MLQAGCWWRSGLAQLLHIFQTFGWLRVNSVSGFWNSKVYQVLPNLNKQSFGTLILSFEEAKESASFFGHLSIKDSRDSNDIATIYFEKLGLGHPPFVHLQRSHPDHNDLIFYPDVDNLCRSGGKQALDLLPMLQKIADASKISALANMLSAVTAFSEIRPMPAIFFPKAGKETKIDAVKADLKNAALDSCILRNINLNSANLSGADLRAADLSGANLAWANLTGADLMEAKLVFANLMKAILSGANLTGADLSYATLTEAILTGAILSGANLTQARLIHAVFSWSTVVRGVKFSDISRLSKLSHYTKILLKCSGANLEE